MALKNIKPVGEQMSICYQFVGWNVVDEFDVVWEFLNSWCQLFVFCFWSSPFLIFGFNLIIYSSSFVKLGFKLPFFGVDCFIFIKRFELRIRTPIFELRFWTIWLSTLKEPSWVRIFKDRFELRFRTAILELTFRTIWLSTLKEPLGVQNFKDRFGLRIRTTLKRRL